MFGLRSEECFKTKAVVDDCIRLKQQGKHVLIVLHRKRHFDVLTSALTKNGLSVDIWNGSVKQKDRSRKLHEWQWTRDHGKKMSHILSETKLGKVAMPNFGDMIAEYWNVPDVLLL